MHNKSVGGHSFYSGKHTSFEFAFPQAVYNYHDYVFSEGDAVSFINGRS